MEWLLDALHEDLNRVTEKPYTELKDSDGRPDEVVAAEAWSQHHSRNQSIVIDLFYGQLKSKVSCQCCGRESVRFDPFSLLSLPLPVENFIYCEVLVIFLDGTMPIKYGLRLNSDSKYLDFKKKLSTLCQLSPNLMLVCEISNSQIKCVLNDELKMKSVNATELVVYQLPEGGEDNRSRTSSIVGLNIEKGLKDIQRNPEQTQNQMTSSTITSSSTTTASTSGTENNTSKDVNVRINGEIECDNVSSKTRTSKHTAEISRSPESTFANVHQKKRISSANLLNDNGQSCNNSSDEISSEKNSIDITEEDYTKNCSSDNDIPLTECPCRSLSENYDEVDNNSVNYQMNLRKQSYFSGTSRNVLAGRYLIAVHRKLTRQDTYFLSYHKTRPSLFGVPLLIPCYENGTNKDLYCAVWRQVNRLLSPLPPMPDQANHAADCDDSLGYDFPFTLRAVCDGGRVCALCPWSSFCRGCEIPCNDDLLLQGPLIPTRIKADKSESRPSTPTFNAGQTIMYSAINIAIDWDPTALHLRYQSTREKLWTEHETVAICRKQQTEPVDLNHCLRAFTSEEKLEQWYHCSHCKGKKPATKKLQIWKLPPILIIHLKRFNCVNGKWVKSQKVVNFPFDNFDPTPYLASVPQETILRHKELKEIKSNNNKNMCNEDCKNELADFDRESTEQEPTILESENETKENFSTNEQIENDNNTTINDNKKSVARKLPSRTLERRKRLISTSLSRTPVIDGHFTDFHQHKLQSNEDSFDLKYNLYAVVSHSGMLNGGHYVSYAANPNGSWYCYNDSSCREIPNRPNIDPSSAYLLFYERRGLDYEPYFPSVEGKTLPNGNVIEADDSDNDIRKMCVIS